MACFTVIRIGIVLFSDDPVFYPERDWFGGKRKLIAGCNQSMVFLCVWDRSDLIGLLLMVFSVAFQHPSLQHRRWLQPQAALCMWVGV